METIENSVMRHVGGSQLLHQSLVKPPLAKERKSLFKVAENKNSSQRINMMRSDQSIQSITMTDDMNKSKLLSRQVANKVIKQSSSTAVLPKGKLETPKSS
jgi:hypothetical protein